MKHAIHDQALIADAEVLQFLTRALSLRERRTFRPGHQIDRSLLLVA